MRTAVELLEAQRASLESLLREFLLEYSAIEKHEDTISGAIFVMPNSWRPLQPAGRALQARLLNEHDRSASLLEFLLRRSPNDARQTAMESTNTLRQIIDRSEGTWKDTPEAVLEEALNALKAEAEVASALYDPTPGEPVFVPDANAVIWNPDIEEWVFEDAPRFSIVLTSTLLGELDDLKNPHRGEPVREKAEGAIRRIKEYGRRGDIHAGVTLKRDRSTVRMTATEPDFKDTLPRLDPSVKDDRLLAACLEVVREHPHSPVVLVTRDINLQNKARHAGIAFVEPPDPPAEVARETPRRRAGPRPDVRLFDLQPIGGSDERVDFQVAIQNYGTQLVRAVVRASIASEAVTCSPASPIELLVNTPSSRIVISVPRPQHGELVPEFDHETTLYGRELLVEAVVDEECIATETWREQVYEPETNHQRYTIQQRYWRFGRGEETDADIRADMMAERLRRIENPEGNSPSYDWS